MGGKGMNGRLGSWAKDNYSDSKSDLFAMFIERGLGSHAAWLQCNGDDAKLDVLIVLRKTTYPTHSQNCN